jgi:hypothetical protein
LAIAGVLALAGCAASTPYRPVGGSRAETGYLESEGEPGHWTVAFKGNASTGPDTVDAYLLYRCADLTLERGYDWFRVVRHGAAADARAYRYAAPGPRTDRPPDESNPTNQPPPTGIGPSWRYRRQEGWTGGWVWRSWDPSRPDPPALLGLSGSAYMASAEIVMGRGARPPGDDQVFDAKEVTHALRSEIIRP